MSQFILHLNKWSYQITDLNRRHRAFKVILTERRRKLHWGISILILGFIFDLVNFREILESSPRTWL